jgi:hypothetical protein
MHKNLAIFKPSALIQLSPYEFVRKRQTALWKLSRDLGECHPEQVIRRKIDTFLHEFSVPDFSMF